MIEMIKSDIHQCDEIHYCEKIPHCEEGLLSRWKHINIAIDGSGTVLA